MYTVFLFVLCVQKKTACCVKNKSPPGDTFVQVDIQSPQIQYIDLKMSLYMNIELILEYTCTYGHNQLQE
jgi:hypothetical protein